MKNISKFLFPLIWGVIFLILVTNGYKLVINYANGIKFLNGVTIYALIAIFCIIQLYLKYVIKGMNSKLDYLGKMKDNQLLVLKQSIPTKEFNAQNLKKFEIEHNELQRQIKEQKYQYELTEKVLYSLTFVSCLFSIVNYYVNG